MGARRTPWWLPHGWHAETWICAMRGHVCLPGLDDVPVQAPRPARPGIDHLMRCLRCDVWVEADEDEIAIAPVTTAKWPRRGKALHEAILMRIVALDRGFHAVVLLLLAGALGWLWLKLPGLTPQARQLSEGLSGISSGVGHLGGVLNSVAKRVARLHTDSIRDLALISLAYGALEGVEAVGLWFEQRWAEYLTVLATSGLLPLEIYEITKNPTAFKISGFVINIIVVAFLVWTKRLFGVRGGAAEIPLDVDAVLAHPNPQRFHVIKKAAAATER